MTVVTLGTKRYTKAELGLVGVHERKRRIARARAHFNRVDTQYYWAHKELAKMYRKYPNTKQYQNEKRQLSINRARLKKDVEAAVSRLSYEENMLKYE